MKKYRVLVLTDHSNHSDQNSIYALLKEMSVHPQCQLIDVVSRGLEKNRFFFHEIQIENIYGSRVDESFQFDDRGSSFQKDLKKLQISEYDLLFLRLPRPVSDLFLTGIAQLFEHTCIINHPKGIIKTSNKKFLLNFPDLCPDIRLCKTLQDVFQAIEEYPIVLKPLKEYGGRGLLKIMNGQVDDGKEMYPAKDYLKKIEKDIEEDNYLAMRYLKNVSHGDKRILVMDGQIMGASLRLPAEDSWLCNVAQGGKSIAADVTEEEINMIQSISPILRKEGVIMYGADTLVNDEGSRVLSEINTLSIGGWPQAEKQTGKPIVRETINKIFAYADSH